MSHRAREAIGSLFVLGWALLVGYAWRKAEPFSIDPGATVPFTLAAKEP